MEEGPQICHMDFKIFYVAVLSFCEPQSLSLYAKQQHEHRVTRHMVL